jgi:maltose alpha-D-glucosyltransferase/alpha-amylase
VKKPASATDPFWYKDAIIYELHVRAFSDSNADGIGDFPGLISKLDYLQELGVTCLWLLPFFPSPLRDDGYDISDYTSVNPSYGTIEDFRSFLNEAHARNMQVMIELVINHTSDQHPWFQRARLAPKDSPDRNMYVWSDTDKLYDGVRIIFTDTEKSNWTWDDVAQQYYWHRFFSHQPDLNFDNPRVMEEVLNAMRFWLDMGVDGLRLDAIPYLVERDGTSCENVPETHVLIKHIRAVMDAEYENRLILAEANMWPADVRPYFGDGDECQMAFHFPLMPRIYMALRQEDRLPITDIMAQTPPIPPNCQWGLFLRNHDELTLEMVTDDERDYMNLAYAADTRMRINVGIRRRLAPLVDNNRRRIELLNSLLLSFPGTPIMYYGDEIGMGDNIYLGDRNGVRTPMQWNSDRNAGFSKAVPAKLYFPVIMDPIWGYQAINVEAQESDPSSLLQWTRNMIALRKIFQVFGRGTLEFLHPENRKILAYIREYEGDDGHTETVLCVANLSRFAQPVQLDLSRYAGRQPVEMLGYVPFPIIDQTPYALTLAPYSFFWLELQPASARLVEPSASLIDETAPAAGIIAPPTAAPSEKPADGTTPSSIAQLLEQHTPAIQALLPAYVAQQRWFGGKSRTIDTVRIVSTTPMGGDASLIALLEIQYKDAASAHHHADTEASDLYQLPLALVTPAAAAALTTSFPKIVIATADQLGMPAVLVDASATTAFQSALLSRIVSTANPSADSDAKPELASNRSATLDTQRLVDLPSRLSRAEQSNTSILYDDIAILKLFRHLRHGENPDVEIARFLTEVAHFPHIPAYFGDLHRTSDGTTLAFLQAFAPNEGDGWAWMLEQLQALFATAAAPSSRTPTAAQLTPAAAQSAEDAFKQADSIAAPPEPAASAATNNQSAEAGLPPQAAASLEAASLIGRRTADLHLALATSTDGQSSSTIHAFAAEPYNAEDLGREHERIEAQLTAALTALERALPTLPAEAATAARAVFDARDTLRARIDALSGNARRFGERIRIHGDYHLGQLLRTPGKEPDFLIVDFEGEPARSLDERRSKQSPLRDVAGMLRSFSYAAQSALNSALESSTASRTTLAPLAAQWERAASIAFLDAYRSTLAANPALTPASDQWDTLLSALLLEKALYELLYELNNRPTWLPIPLNGLLSIARRRD